MLAKDTLKEFKVECEFRRLTPRTIEGYYNNTLFFLKHLIEKTTQTKKNQELTLLVLRI